MAYYGYGYGGYGYNFRSGSADILQAVLRRHGEAIQSMKDYVEDLSRVAGRPSASPRPVPE